MGGHRLGGVSATGLALISVCCVRLTHHLRPPQAASTTFLPTCGPPPQAVTGLTPVVTGLTPVAAGAMVTGLTPLAAGNGVISNGMRGMPGVGGRMGMGGGISLGVGALGESQQGRRGNGVCNTPCVSRLCNNRGPVTGFA